MLTLLSLDTVLGPSQAQLYEADQRLQLGALLPGAFPEGFLQQDLLPAAAPGACSSPQPSLIPRSLLLQNWGSQEEDAA